MRYTIQRMEDHVRQLVTAKNMRDWPVGGGGLMSADADLFCPQLRLAERERRWNAMAPGALKDQVKKDLLVGELTAFCFKCYEAAYTATNDQIIGRFDDLLQRGVYQQVANMLPDNPVVQLPPANRPTARNLFQAGARGNALLMDKWATMMNDAWILGGMHRGANFQLYSQKTLDNLWNQGGGYLVVTAREILGLSEYGYALQMQGPNQVFVRQNWKSRFISLIDYDNFIEKNGTVKRAFEMAIPNSVAPTINKWNRGNPKETAMRQIFHVHLARTRPAAVRNAHRQNLNAVFGQLPNRVN